MLTQLVDTQLVEACTLRHSDRQRVCICSACTGCVIAAAVSCHLIFWSSFCWRSASGLLRSIRWAADSTFLFCLAKTGPGSSTHKVSFPRTAIGRSQSKTQLLLVALGWLVIMQHLSASTSCLSTTSTVPQVGTIWLNTRLFACLQG